MKIRVNRGDSLPAVGAYLRNMEGPVDDEPLIVINVDYLLGELVDEDNNPVEFTTDDRKRAIVETIMHEFGHVLEHWFNLEVSEQEIESAVQSFKE